MHEILVGVDVKNLEGYQKYRELIMPLLTAGGGSFRYDFSIAETLKSEADEKMNRVFVIRFPSVSAKKRLFEDEGYKKIKEQYFVKSVSSSTLISEYEISSDQ